jgi:hypothetical protein
MEAIVVCRYAPLREVGMPWFGQLEGEVGLCFRVDLKGFVPQCDRLSFQFIQVM